MIYTSCSRCQSTPSRVMRLMSLSKHENLLDGQSKTRSMPTIQSRENYASRLTFDVSIRQALISLLSFMVA